MLAHKLLPLCRAAPAVRMTRLTSRLPCNQFNLSLCQARTLYTPNDAVQKQGSYEGPGKTTVAILNEDSAGLINMVDSYAVDGFRLNDDTKILGPCVIFPTQILGMQKISFYNFYTVTFSVQPGRCQGPRTYPRSPWPCSPSLTQS